MKKLNFFILLLLVVLTAGCTSLNETISNVIPKKSSNIPLELQEQMATRVNPEQELFALGSADMEASGAIIAQSKANKNARDILKGKVKKEVEINFNSFLLNMDSYSKGLASPVLSDLNEYASELVLKNAVQKGAWENNQKIYSLFTVSRDDIAEQARNVFSSFLDDISGRLLNTKERIIENE